jgi:hypothetical protein
VCANGATITGGAPCSDLPMCESVFAPGTCQALCFPAGGVTSATCVLC